MAEPLTPTNELTLWVVISANQEWPGDPVIAELSRRLGHATIKPTATHAFLVLREPSGNVYAIEAVPHKGVHLFTLDEKVWQRLRWYRVPGTQAQIRTIWREAERHLNRPYDWPGLLLTLTFMLCKRPGLFYIKRARLFCSALVAWVLKVGGFDVLPGVHIDNIDPARLDGVLAIRGWGCDAPDWFIALSCLPVRPTAAPYHSPF